MNRDSFEIIDDNGVIYSGYTEDETRDIFQSIIEGDEEWILEDELHGDVKLIEVHAVHK